MKSISIGSVVAMFVLLGATAAEGAAVYEGAGLTIATDEGDSSTVANVGCYSNPPADPTDLTITATGSLTASALYIACGNLTGRNSVVGTLTAEGDLSAGTTSVGMDGTGRFVIDGGAATLGSMLIGRYMNSASHGTFTMHNGSSLTCGESTSDTANFGYTAGGVGTGMQYGGDANFAGYVYVGRNSGYGSYTISGGTFDTYQLVINNGSFNVVGSAIGNITTTSYLTVNPTGILGFTVDAGGVTTIDCYRAILNSGGIIDMDIADGVSIADGASYDLVVSAWGYLPPDVLVLADGDEYIPNVRSGWTLTMEDTVGSPAYLDTIRATYQVVPEPAMMSLLGIGVLLGFRRKR